MNNTIVLSTVEKAAVSSIIVLLSGLGLFGYGIVCPIFLKHINTDFKNPFYKLALALAFCDCTYLFFTTYFLNLPIILSTNHELIYSDTVRTVFHQFTVWNYYSMYALILVISINRYISISYYANYTNICNNFRINIAIVVALLLGSSMVLFLILANCWSEITFFGVTWACQNNDAKVKFFFAFAAVFPATCSIIICSFYLLSFLKYRKIINHGQLTSGLKREWALMFQFFLISFCALIMVIVYWIIASAVPLRISQAVMLVLCCINNSINPYCYLFFNMSVRKYLPAWIKPIFTLNYFQFMSVSRSDNQNIQQSELKPIVAKNTLRYD